MDEENLVMADDRQGTDADDPAEGEANRPQSGAPAGTWSEESTTPGLVPAPTLTMHRGTKDTPQAPFEAQQGQGLALALVPPQPSPESETTGLQTTLQPTADGGEVVPLVVRRAPTIPEAAAPNTPASETATAAPETATAAPETATAAPEDVDTAPETTATAAPETARVADAGDRSPDVEPGRGSQPHGPDASRPTAAPLLASELLAEDIEPTEPFTTSGRIVSVLAVLAVVPLFVLAGPTPASMTVGALLGVVAVLGVLPVGYGIRAGATLALCLAGLGLDHYLSISPPSPRFGASLGATSARARRRAPFPPRLSVVLDRKDPSRVRDHRGCGVARRDDPD